MCFVRFYMFPIKQIIHYYCYYIIIAITICIFVSVHWLTPKFDVQFTPLKKYTAGFLHMLIKMAESKGQWSKCGLKKKVSFESMLKKNDNSSIIRCAPVGENWQGILLRNERHQLAADYIHTITASSKCRSFSHFHMFHAIFRTFFKWQPLFNAARNNL